MYNILTTYVMSHVKTMQAFGQLKGICTGLGGAYNPGQENLQVKALTTIQFNAQQVMDEVKVAKTVYDNITNQRELAFRETRLLGSRICFLLRACGAHPLTLADAYTSNRSLQGARKYRSPALRPVEGDDATDSNRKRMSTDYASKVQYFAQLVETAAAEPNYNPTERELSVEGLEEKVLQLRSLNELVMKAEQRLKQLRQQRREIFYEGEHSLVNTARAAKNYIRGVFGFASVPSAELMKVSFTKPVTR